MIKLIGVSQKIKLQENLWNGKETVNDTAWLEITKFNNNTIYLDNTSTETTLPINNKIYTICIRIKMYIDIQ